MNLWVIPESNTWNYFKNANILKYLFTFNGCKLTCVDIKKMRLRNQTFKFAELLYVIESLHPMKNIVRFTQRSDQMGSFQTTGKAFTGSSIKISQTNIDHDPNFLALNQQS